MFVKVELEYNLGDGDAFEASMELYLNEDGYVDRLPEISDQVLSEILKEALLDLDVELVCAAAGEWELNQDVLFSDFNAIAAAALAQVGKTDLHLLKAYQQYGFRIVVDENRNMDTVLLKSIPFALFATPDFSVAA